MLKAKQQYQTLAIVTLPELGGTRCTVDHVTIYGTKRVRNRIVSAYQFKYGYDLVTVYKPRKNP